MINISSARPARAAIAAVLAFSATPLFAQDIAPPVVAPTVAPAAPVAVAAPAPVAAAPAPVMAAPAPVVQAVPSVEERRAASIAQAQAEAAERSAPARVERASAAPVVERTPVERRAVAPVESVPAPIAAAPVTPVAPAPVEAAPAPAVAPPAAPVVSDGNGDALGWGLAGGALLLIGIAGTMAMRRRKVNAPANDAMVSQTSYVPSVAAPEAAMPLMAEPAMVSRPLAQTAPHGSIEQMVAAPPSAANPFLTRRNRLRRAEFLVRQSEQRIMPSPVAVAQPEREDRSQTVYRFGVEKQPRIRWVPAKQ